MSMIERAITYLGRTSDPETVRAEIEEEIEFHLAQRERELREEGMDPADAERRAREMFGDVNRMTLECLTARLGKRALVQRIQWVVIALLAIVLFGTWRTHAATAAARESELAALYQEQAELRDRAEQSVAGPEPSPPSAEELASQFAEQEGWRHALATADLLLTRVAPEETADLLVELWPRLSDGQQQQVLKSVALRHGHPATLRVFHLGMTDSSLEVQAWASTYLEDYAFRQFAVDHGSYRAWYEEWKDSSLGDVLIGNARELVERLLASPTEQLLENLNGVRRLDLRPARNLGVELPAAMRDAGVLALLEEWVVSDDEDLRELALGWAGELAPDEAWLRAHVLPILDGPDVSAAGDALRTLGRPENEWAIPEIAKYLREAVLPSGARSSTGAVSAAARALADIGDPATIPTMIGLIASNPCYETIYGIGYYGLGKLTGVS